MYSQCYYQMRSPRQSDVREAAFEPGHFSKVLLNPSVWPGTGKAGQGMGMMITGNGNYR